MDSRTSHARYPYIQSSHTIAMTAPAPSTAARWAPASLNTATLGARAAELEVLALEDDAAVLKPPVLPVEVAVTPGVESVVPCRPRPPDTEKRGE